MASTLRKRIIRNLRYFRNRAGLSQQELSRRCELDISYVGKVESGEMNPSLDALSRLSQQLDCSSQRLVRREGPEPASLSPPVSKRLERNFLLDRLVRKINRPVAIVSSDGLVLDVNQAFYEYRELASDEPVGKLFWKLSMWELRGGGREKLKTTMMKTLREHVSMLVRVESGRSAPEGAFRILFGVLDDKEFIGEYATVEILEPGANPPARIAVEGLDMIAQW